MLFDNIILGPARIVKKLAEVIEERADEQLYSIDAIRNNLMELEQKLQNGDITEEEYDELEEEIMERLKIAQKRKQQS